MSRDQSQKALQPFAAVVGATSGFGDVVVSASLDNGGFCRLLFPARHSILMASDAPRCGSLSPTQPYQRVPPRGTPSLIHRRYQRDPPPRLLIFWSLLVRLCLANFLIPTTIVVVVRHCFGCRDRRGLLLPISDFLTCSLFSRFFDFSNFI